MTPYSRIIIGQSVDYGIDYEESEEENYCLFYDGIKLEGEFLIKDFDIDIIDWTKFITGHTIAFPSGDCSDYGILGVAIPTGYHDGGITPVSPEFLRKLSDLFPIIKEQIERGLREKGLPHDNVQIYMVGSL